MSKEKENIFSVNDFYGFDSNILKLAEHEVIWLRRSFDENIPDEKTDVGFASMYAYMILKQLQDYFNDELCVSSAFLLLLIKSETVKFKVKAYHAENLIFRLVTFWDYYYTIINEYLQLGFIADHQIKQQIITSKCYDIHFIPIDGGKGSKVVTTPKDEEVQKRIKEELNNSLTVINKRDVKKVLHRNFALTDRFKKILKLIDSPCIKDLKKIRNQVIHRRSLGADVTVDLGFLGQSISVKREGWLDFEALAQIIQKNLKTIGDALQLMHEVILLDERPNSIENKDRQFFVCQVKCTECGADDILTESLMEEPDKVFCTSCWKLSSLKTIECVKSNEINHGYRLYQYYEKFMKYMDEKFPDAPKC